MVNDKREPDYSDPSLAINSRVGYPVEYIPNAAIPGVGGIPKVVIFLTCDSFGVLPPISLLSKEAAMYQFVTGFTSKVAGTEIGINEPVPTFSTLFGEPFMPLRASVYANMLGERIEKRLYLAVFNLAAVERHDRFVLAARRENDETRKEHRRRYNCRYYLFCHFISVPSAEYDLPFIQKLFRGEISGTRRRPFFGILSHYLHKVKRFARFTGQPVHISGYFISSVKVSIREVSHQQE